MVYFFIGTPLISNDRNVTWNIINNEIFKNGQQATAKQLGEDEIRQMKLGNLDALLHAGEQMVKLEGQVETFLRKLERQYLDINEKGHHDFTIDSKNSQCSIEQYLKNFKWEDTIVSKAQSLPDKLLAIKKKLTSSEEDFRQKSHAFQEKKNIQQSLQTKEGNLFIKDLADVLTPDVVNEQDFHYTSNITTLIAVVPKVRLEQFQQKYDSFENVLPKSAKQFTKVQDKDGITLWRILFYTQDFNKKSQQQDEDDKKKGKVQKTPLEQYLSWTRDQIGVTVREFHYNKKTYDLKQQARNVISKEAQNVTVLRLYVDIASRFGQREDILKAIVEVTPNKEKKVLTELMKLFISPGQQSMYGTKEELEDTEDFFPYVYIPININ
ncbi:hypothetical protein PPERSA_07657 [Pseudocohnilembus persalinus]|uniref:V-type proton ATPase subunit C n=1 Tax=Pseudocohnilembus persalinus TaxID=266149 RepID=A0A0V0QIP5_PSEPJ|nr:hypothetical protein PPERSA_07657 [Pseudocohnilembus persalinus]|eukprot:KRX02012.1 hypothetical protein PPERSA_07657 [Pseudocohnilembus persalinus]